ncbi:WXG100 family type VII secretion target [Corynebacterium sanguinis]|uniref:ESAT-6-like protein n=1 Tax=Corynebacterium sanguinis TaxID=2594913 RepID=A0A6C1TZT6_9CORY|nr:MULTISPECIES: WXG100 family type VII secretion target [Corynebacterium]MBA4504135.1 WXG100 family type VII secretion target [Corynebacterium sanguinis]MCT1413473.1 WXG100 family type VII secretion target [Corynebacterium sanguinis]MCT1425428.1 WXG100 family type VII secretion target [Corynebacterium sanguinis]MCT1445128.1 WXG100 family type VII secretion target [Corynebacterium sanguinis]MCT1464194.1 WXG100 family type VII secretion target [Corynebacterium sanguinis]
MAQLQTEADVMRSAANNVDDTNNAVNREIERIQGVVEGTRSYWQGEAQTSFDGVMLRYDDAQRRLGQALAAIAENLRDNAKNYENIEASNTDDLRSISTSAGLAL